MTRARAKNVVERMAQKVFSKEPPLTSPASLALLNKKYFELDKTVYSNSRMSSLRKRWFKLQMKTPDELNGLTCNICGKKGLLPDAPNLNDRATLDHVFEVGLGGEWNNPSNFQTACYRCNSFKNKKLQQR